MKPGSSLGLWALLALLGSAPYAGAQNLGLGAGSRPSSDSAREYRSGDEAPAPRRQQMNKRLGLTARRNPAFDPKIFEARGRELQGQFYEIGTPVSAANLGPSAFASPESPGREGEIHRKGRRSWMIWAGVAGAVGVSAGAVGYWLMYNAHPTAPPPVKIEITDDP